eukprot:845469-Rhodomonas_salina.1
MAAKLRHYYRIRSETPVNSAICLRAQYAVSSSYYSLRSSRRREGRSARPPAGSILCICYAMPGTIQCMCCAMSDSILSIRYAMPGGVVCHCYAMSGTDTGWCAIRTRRSMPKFPRGRTRMSVRLRTICAAHLTLRLLSDPLMYPYIHCPIDALTLARTHARTNQLTLSLSHAHAHSLWTAQQRPRVLTIHSCALQSAGGQAPTGVDGLHGGEERGQVLHPGDRLAVRGGTEPSVPA